MSVLKSKRNESRAEFVNTANKIYEETIAFIVKLSSKYSRVFSADTARLASKVLDHAEMANSIYPSDEIRKEERERHLLNARASLMALDVHLSHCYRAMMKNPYGCFVSDSGECRDATAAMRKLDNMAQSLGSLIDLENGYLSALLKSDKRRSQ